MRISYFLYVLLVILTLSGSACNGLEESTLETEPDNNITGEIDPEPERGADSLDDLTVEELPVADQIENRFEPEFVFQGAEFIRPLLLTEAGDESGRLFVVEQAGLIYVMAGIDTQEKVLFLDISDSIDDSGNEMGLLGLAFHPDYVNNGYFFVNYTDREGTVVARFTSVGSDANPESHETVLSFNQPYSNHNGGHIEFGPDGFLYIATGDGGSGGDPQGHAQNRQTLYGNILRIDIDNQGPLGSYSIPPDNPFVGNRDDFREEIYAYGLRNPWRFSFDPLTGQLWAADVGQNAVEEINVIEKGKNYGWNIMEGSQCYDPPNNCDTAGLEMPVFEYSHSLGRSITGGYVYRGTEHPLLKGAYIYADFITGLIWALWYQDGEVKANYVLADTGLNISSFGVGEHNELYFTAFDGYVYKLVYN